MENTNSLQKINLRDFRKTLLPTKPRIFVQEYDNYNPETKRDMNNNPENYKKFWFHPEVAGYIETKGMIIGRNYMNRKNLMLLKADAEAKGESTEIHDGLLAEYEPEDYMFPYELKLLQIEENRHVATDPVVKKVSEQFAGGYATSGKRKDWNNE